MPPDIVNRQGDDIATSARFVRYRTNSTLSSLSPTIYAAASDWGGQMTTKQIVARLGERIYALVTTGDPVDVVVWRHPEKPPMRR